MGQAKQRGTPEERKAQAVARDKEIQDAIEWGREDSEIQGHKLDFIVIDEMDFERGGHV